MTTEQIDMILKIILTVLGILIPVGVKYVVKKLSVSKVLKVKEIADLAVEFIVKFYEMNPDIKATENGIFKMFKERVLVILPLSPAELQYIYEQVLGDIVKALERETGEKFSLAKRDICLKAGNILNTPEIDVDTIKKSDLLFQ